MTTDPAFHSEDIPEETTEKPIPDRPFNPFRVPRGGAAKSIVKTIIAQLEAYEENHGLRKRKRRPKDQEIFEATVAAVISNLIHLYLTEPAGSIAVSLSREKLGRAGRYRSPVMNSKLPDVIKSLAAPELAFLWIEKGHQGLFGNPKQTTMGLTGNLVDMIQTQGLSKNDLAEDSCQEIIILKREKKDVFDDGEWIEYQDTEESRALRDQMNQINQRLAKADIELNGFTAIVHNTHGSDRLLRRYFNNGSFEAGGRLFGGFWQALKKEARREGIRINGEPVVTVDFSRMAPTILYSMAHLELPEKDPYAVHILGHVYSKAGLPVPEKDPVAEPEWYHGTDGIKKIFGSLLFATKPLTRFPRDTKKLFHKNAGIQDIVEAVMHHHEPVRHLFYTGIGFKVLRKESDIMVGILLQLMARDIVALPIHDAVIVAQSCQEEVVMVMEDTFAKHTGIQGRVHVERDTDPCL